MKDPYNLRDSEEILRAHDLLAALVHNDLLAEPMKTAIEYQLDVLCWVLQHDDESVFASNMAMVERVMTRFRLRLTRDQPGAIDPKEVM